jgi:hypothetical protein
MNTNMSSMAGTHCDRGTGVRLARLQGGKSPSPHMSAAGRFAPRMASACTQEASPG